MATVSQSRQLASQQEQHKAWAPLHGAGRDPHTPTKKQRGEIREETKSLFLFATRSDSPRP